MADEQRQYELLIFDWDGTLMDSEAHIVECLERAMRAVDMEPLPSSELRQVIGLGLEEAIAGILPQAPAPVRQQAVTAFREHFLSPHPTPSKLFPDLNEVLQTLRQQGYAMAVATGKSRRGLDKVMKQTGLGEYFSVSRCADETFSKPHPLMVEEILTDMNTSPQRALVIGDTEFDLQMAANAGVPAVGVSYGVHGIERLESASPLTILHRIAELPEWLNGGD
jgi:phosphoglycolate phosphatase